MNEEQQAFLALMAKHAAEREASMTRRAEDFAKQCVPILAEHGVRKLRVHYSGSGDSGGVDGVEMLGDGDAVLRLDGVDAMLGGTAGVFEGLIEQILPGGFEINDGGQGTLTFDLVKGSWSLDHEENVTSVEEHHTEGKF